MGNEERIRVLEMIAEGKITAQQGVDLLNALGEDAELEGLAETASDLPAGETSPGEAQLPSQPVIPLPEAASSAPLASPVEYSTGAGAETPTPDFASDASRQTDVPPEPEVGETLPQSPSFDPRAKKWSGWWRIPLGIGVVATILTGLLLYSIYTAAGFNFWFACAFIPFLISVAVVALAWASRSAHWLHVRVHQRPGERPQNIVISFPIPLSIMGWFLRTFRGKIPGMQGVNSDEMILALNHVSRERPFYVEVNEDNGERVEVYIG